MRADPLTIARGWGFPGLLVALITVTIVVNVRSWLRLRHIPGPPFAALSKLWMLRKTSGGRFYLDLAEACEKYGPIVRIGPNDVVTNDFEVWRKINAVRSPYRRSNWYDGMRFDPDYNNILSERDDKIHNTLRAKMAAGYSGKENDHLEQAVDANIAQFIQLLESKYLSTSTSYNPVDLSEKIMFFTLDVISDLAFGESFGNLRADKDDMAYIKTNEELLPFLVLLGTFPGLTKLIFSKIFRGFLPKDTDPIGMGRIMGIAKEVVSERFGPDKKTRQDMLGSFLRHGLTQREAQTEVVFQVFAGADTTATTIRATFLHIVTNPHIYSTLLNEIATSSISNPITDEEARKLPYLQAVVKEGLRILPPIPGLLPKEVPTGGVTLKGLYIPEKTSIGWSVFGMMRDEKIWGPDAWLFRPERWLEGTPEEIREKELDIEMVFGYGKWSCLGKNVAYIELNKIFIQLLRNFEIAIVDPAQPWKSWNSGLFITSDMWMRVTKREPSL